MVNEDPSAPGSDRFSDGAPASDDDPYSIPPENSNSLRIDGLNLPKAMPIFGPLFGFNDQLVARLVNNRVQAAARVVQRNVTAEEATAIAYWTAKNISIISYGGPIGIAAGAWRAYSTAGTFKLPLYQPNLENFNPTMWPASRLILLSGPRAVAAWHLCRLFPYSVVGNFIGKSFAAVYGTSITIVGEATDPRLAEYTQAKTKAAQTARGRLPNQARPAGTVDGLPNKEASAPWRKHRSQIDDDASPTGGAYGNTETGSADIPVTPEKGISEPGPSMLDRRRGPSAQAHDGAGPPKGVDRDQHPPLFDDFDEASAADGRHSGGKIAAGGSAWERIRQQAGNPAAGGRRTTSPLGTSKSASPSDHRAPVQDRYHDGERGQPGRRGAGRDRIHGPEPETDREISRARAQEEFDARVDQERRGGEFRGDPGEPKRW